MLLTIRNLHFSYNSNSELFRNLNLNIEKGKIIALAGESGCGKSTLLNLIYGLLDWEKGEIVFNDKNLLGPKGNLVPGENDMKLVAQNYDLMPYATVAENVGKFLSNINIAQKKDKISELLSVVGMEDYAGEFPKNLSGGQQQRVAIARALSVMPKLLLLDEPFSHLDFSRKAELRENLFGYTKKMDISVIISTHEIQEVMPWINQIIVLQEGRLIQNDTPEETYNNPYNSYVAKLFGDVNVLSDEQKFSLNSSRNFVFPDKILIDENGMTAAVIESLFAGNHYWNRIICKDIPLICYSEKKLPETVQITLE